MIYVLQFFIELSSWILYAYLCKSLALEKIDIAYMSDLCTAFCKLDYSSGPKEGLKIRGMGASSNVLSIICPLFGNRVK